MQAYIALEKYLKNEEKDFGVGVPVSINEEIAKYESTRIKGLDSYNNWISINIPDTAFFLDIEKSIKEQSNEVLNNLLKREFILALFYHEGKKLISDFENRFVTESPTENKKEIINKYFDEFISEKNEFLLKFPSGKQLFNYVNSKCITHDKAKSSSLLYTYGIKGISYKDDIGDRLLMFNAQKDIEPLQFRNGQF